MDWLTEYVDLLFDADDPPDREEFAAEHGIAPEMFVLVDEKILFDTMMRRFRRESVWNIPKLCRALLDKGQRGDVPAIRLLLMAAKPEEQKGKTNDTMEAFREN